MSERISVDELLSHTEWLRHLARALVADRHAADDLVQSSLSAALSRPPRRRGGGLRIWLRRVLVNRVRQDRRNVATRERLQRQVARRVEQPSTLSLVARTEIQSAMIQAVLRLEEPYRSTILRRYYEDRSAVEIARDDGIPASTVRNRLHRGIDRLREGLRARYGNDDERWLSSIALLVSGGPGVQGGAPITATSGTRLPGLGLSAVPLVGLAVLVAALVLWDTSPVPPAGRGPAAADDGARAADPVATPGDRDAGSVPLQRGVVPAGGTADGIEVRVLDLDGLPAPGATVRFARMTRAARENLESGGPDHPHSEAYRFAFLAEQYGEQRSTDHDGRVWLPAEDDRVLVVAFDGAGFGSATIAEGDRSPVEIHLEIDETLQVRTIDAAGGPAGLLPVRVAVRVPDRPDNSLWVGRTDVSGAASIRHFQLLQPRGEGAASARYGVSFDFPVHPHVTAEFGRRVPASPVVLTAPAHGRLRLSFAGPEGRPVIAPVLYYRLQVEFAIDGDADAFPASIRRWIRGLPLPGEHVVELPVGLGARISASGQLQPVGELVEASFVGPVAPGEIVEHVLHLDRRHLVLRGRVHGPGQTRLAGTMRALSVRGAEQLADHQPTLMGDGTFEIVLRVRDQARPSGVYLHLRNRSGEEFGALVPVAGTAAAEDLGAVELRALTRVVEGAVVDERGQPVPGAEIQVWVQDGGTRVRDRRFAGRSDADGGFRLAVPDSLAGFSLLASRRGHLMRSPVLADRESLEMVRAAEISGSLLLPPGIGPADVVVRVRTAVSSEVDDRAELRERRGQFEFRLGDLWPGRYRVGIQVNGEPEPFREIGVFDLAAGQALRGGQLQRIDLRHDLHRIEVVATDVAGNPLSLPGAGLTAVLPAAGGDRFRRIVPWREDRAEFVSSLRSLTIEFGARGWRPWRGTVHEGLNVLRLPRAR